MLKGKRSISACSLSSCRLRAEALARAFNNRIWPCVWISQRSSSERDDGMSNGIDNEEEFFDASPSPVELEDESLFCQQHSSAATKAGRAKLYQLLQHHATDDAIDVFYDVGEEATLNDTACDSCFDVDAKESNKVLCESLQNSRISQGVTYLPNDLNGEVHKEFTSDEKNQSNNSEMKPESSDNTEIKVNDNECQETILDSFEGCSSTIKNDENSQNLSNNFDYQTSENSSNESENIIVEKEILNRTVTENIILNEGLCSERISAENNEHKKEIENKEEITVLPSPDIFSEVSSEEQEANFLNKEKHPRVLSKSLLDEDINTDVPNENETTVQVTIDSGSPSTSSDSSDIKPISPPLTRLQVFEDPRPKILRSTSLKTGKTPPGTPSRKKIVRFADVLGLDLEDVRHIMTGDLPIIPSSAYTDLNLKDVVLQTCEPISEKVEVCRRDSSNWQVVKGSTGTNVFYPLFSPPGEQSDFLERVRQQGICLETITVSDVYVQCTCRVVNYGYHKKVIARYTVSDWLSYNDIDASYVSGSSNGDTDKFAFSIFISPLNKNLKFALKYYVNGKEYWDNNRNQNYCFGYHGNDPMNLPCQPLPSFQHDFW